MHFLLCIILIKQQKTFSKGFNNDLIEKLVKQHNVTFKMCTVFLTQCIKSISQGPCHLLANA